MSTRQQHAPRVYLVVDPVQNYEESLEVWGVFGSLEAAKVGVRLLRRRHYSRGIPYEDERVTRVQLWEGVTLAKQWEFDPTARRWRDRWREISVDAF